MNILGLDSAALEAEKKGLGNMVISAPMVIEMSDSIYKLQAENERLKSELTDSAELSDIDNIEINQLKHDRDALLAFTIKRFPIVKALGGLLEVNKIIASEMDSILGKFRLEQQAKGVELALDQVGVSTSPIGTLVQLAEQLRNQAKEQGE